MSTEHKPSEGPYLFDLPTYQDERGRLTVAESGEAVPFDIERIYLLYEVPANETRGNHAHRKLEQVIVAAAGAFDVTLEGSFGRKRFRIDSPDRGLYVPQMTWRELSNFSDGANCLVIASHPYDADDYIHNQQTFREAIESP